MPIAPLGQSAWIQFEYPDAYTVRAVSFARSDRVPLQQFLGGPPGPELQASQDGLHFRLPAKLPNDRLEAQHTIAVPETTARYFRLSFATTPPSPAKLGDFDFGSAGFKMGPPPVAYQVSEFVLHAGARINRFEEKAGFGLLPDFTSHATPATSAAFAVQKCEVIDVSRYLKPDGRFEWTPPAGRWLVLRMGYSPTGVTNHPASPEGTGLEVDKLSAQHVREYMSRYLDNYRSAVGPLMGRRGLQYMLSDSYEAGPQNWTEDLPAQFTRRRGYDPRPWLPTLTGRLGAGAQRIHIRSQRAIEGAYNFDQVSNTYDWAFLGQLRNELPRMLLITKKNSCSADRLWA